MFDSMLIPCQFYCEQGLQPAPEVDSTARTWDMYLKVYIHHVLTTAYAVSNLSRRQCLSRCDHWRFSSTSVAFSCVYYFVAFTILKMPRIFNVSTVLLVFKKYLNFSYCTDCCDGSDEYEGPFKCTNSCWEAGKAAREKLAKKVNVYKEGVKLRRSELESGKKLRQQNENKLITLRKEEKLLSAQVKKLKGWYLMLFSPNSTGLRSIIDRSLFLDVLPD